MSSIVISGDTSGAITLAAPAVSGTNTATFPAATGTVVLSGSTPTLNGITFPATQVPSADANTLDDYEEGTWTPTVYIGATLQTVTAASGTYTKIGNTVFISGRCEGVTKSGTGNLEIRNLPFTISGADLYSQVTMRWSGISSGGVIVPIFSPGSTVISPQNIASTGYSGSTNNTQINASFDLYGFSGFYKV